jgi:hypothetical protein
MHQQQSKQNNGIDFPINQHESKLHNMFLPQPISKCQNEIKPPSLVTGFIIINLIQE